MTLFNSYSTRKNSLKWIRCILNQPSSLSIYVNFTNWLPCTLQRCCNPLWLIRKITLICVSALLWMVVIWTGFKGGSIAFEPGMNILLSIHGIFVWSILQKHSNWDVRRAFKTFFSAPYQKNKKNIFCFCRGKKWFSFSKMRNFVHLPRDKLLQVKRGERRGRKGAKVLVHSSQQWFTTIAPVNKSPFEFLSSALKKSDSCNR